MKRFMIALVVIASIFTVSLNNSVAAERGAVVDKITSIVKISKNEKSDDSKNLVSRIKNLTSKACEACKSGVDATADAVKDVTDGSVAAACEKCRNAVSKAKDLVAKVRKKVTRKE